MIGDQWINNITICFYYTIKESKVEYMPNLK